MPAIEAGWFSAALEIASPLLYVTPSLMDPDDGRSPASQGDVSLR